ncbi:hypothetical protein [Undibacterium pigrum]|uniref:Uncharacterized protein n=1 Tax=Undibacterium pigrum TaxID=401470 RepID=A0A318JDF1_9BURK|nr:hypothetical protein [Undibacterium pigrum]PXX44980.1 hypothetical protein DFR42_102192 [Undibacterium pigrum]
MIVAIVTADFASAKLSTATRLAERRAHAGRNVLLLKQNSARKQANQYRKEAENIAWSRQEIKTAASSTALSCCAIAKELTPGNANFHDIVMDISKPFYADAATALSCCELLVCHTELDKWNKEKQAKLYKCIRLARNKNKGLPVLITIDKIACMQSQKFISDLSRQLCHIKFIYLDQAHDMSLTQLYRAIYLP